jgi:serine/threonine protein phosphatase PrpC
VNKPRQQFQVGFLSEAGNIPASKEYFTGVELAKFACWIFTEQLDSCLEKESAKLAALQLKEDFTVCPTMSRSKIKEYLRKAHQKLITESDQIKLRAGLLMVVTDYTKIIWVVAGNIRMYHLRQGKVNLRSKDQTIAQVMLDAGNLTETELYRRNERNGLICFLGTLGEFKPVVSQAYRLQDGDQLLICNINFWENLTNEEIISACPSDSKPVASVKRLQMTLLAKRPSALNYFMAVITIKGPALKSIGDFHLNWLKIAVLLILLMGIGIMRHRAVTSIPSLSLGLYNEQSVGQPKDDGLTKDNPSTANLVQKQKMSLETIDKTSPTTAQSERESQAMAVEMMEDQIVQPERENQAVAAKRVNQIAPPERENQVVAAKRVNQIVQPKRESQTVAAKRVNQTAPPKRENQVVAAKRVNQIVQPKQESKLIEPFQASSVRGTDSPHNNGEDSERTAPVTRQKTPIKTAEALEATGDDRYQREKYPEALEYYKQAYRIYRKMGMKEAAQSVERKINDTIKRNLSFWFKQRF